MRSSVLRPLAVTGLTGQIDAVVQVRPTENDDIALVSCRYLHAGDTVYAGSLPVLNRQVPAWDALIVLCPFSEQYRVLSAAYVACQSCGMHCRVISLISSMQPAASPLQLVRHTL